MTYATGGRGRRGGNIAEMADSIKALQLNIIKRDLNIESLDIGIYHTMSLESSPRSGLNVDLVWTQLPHSLDTQSTPHPQTHEYALPDLTSAEAERNC